MDTHLIGCIFCCVIIEWEIINWKYMYYHLRLKEIVQGMVRREGHFVLLVSNTDWMETKAKFYWILMLLCVAN